MKYFNHKIIGIAMMCATVMACTDKYDCNLQVEKPEEVANSEYWRFYHSRQFIERGWFLRFWRNAISS